MPREVRPVEVRVAENDEKIVFCNAKIYYYQQRIRQLEEKKDILLHPENKKPTIAQVIKKAKDSGMSLEEIARKLKLNLSL